MTHEPIMAGLTRSVMERRTQSLAMGVSHPVLTWCWLITAKLTATGGSAQ